MRRPALSTLAVGTFASMALALSVAAPVLAEDAASPAASDSTVTGTAATEPPADPTAPVEATGTTTDTTGTTTEATPTSDVGAAADATPTATTDATPTATPSATPTPQIGGNGAYAYPFVLLPGEDGSATVAIEVAGTGIALSYTVDDQGKVTDALIATGDATVLKVTPHTVQLVLATGERVTLKIHGDSVRVKVKPRKGGPLRPGIASTEEVAADETAAAEPSESPAAATEAPAADAAAPAEKGAHGQKGKDKAADAKAKHSGKGRGNKH